MRWLARALWREEKSPQLAKLAATCLAGVAEAVQLMTTEAPVLSVANAEAVGQEATAEQFFEIIRSVDRGRISSEKWAAQDAPDDMLLVDARSAAAQSKTQLRTVKITGATAGARSTLDIGELDRRTKPTKRQIHRQAVLAGGCGG